MTWPSATDYNAAVQNPRLCFRDDDLRQGQAVGDMFGLPRPHSGSFADVYQIQGADKQCWAIKCFTRPVAGLHARYQAISEHLRQMQRAFMVEFCYLDEGICIHGQWYPLVKMRWVEGFRLNDFLREQLDKPVLLERLAQMWIRLGQELRDARMAHGDLQHGNVLLTPGSKSTLLALKLIDYDGMFVPMLADRPSGEVGHPSYQHPQRLREGSYNSEMDRFAQLSIYTALRCLRLGGAELWQRYDNLENLLFREEDFRQPNQSQLLRELWEMKDRDVHFLVGHLLLASQGPLVVVPSLDELVDESGIRPLSDSEETQLAALLEGAPRRPRRTRVAIPAAVGAAVESAAVMEVPPVPTSVVIALPTSPDIALADTQAHLVKATPPPLPRLQTPAPPTHPSRRSLDEIHQDTNPPEATAAAKRFDSARLLDPLVAILSRPLWLAVLGTLALVSFLVVNILVWSTVKEPLPGTAGEERRPALPELEDIALQGGDRKDIPLRIQRHNCRESLTVRVENLPGDMTVSPLHLKADQEHGTLSLLAPQNTAPSERKVLLTLWQGEEKLDEKHFHLTVRAAPPPPLPQPKVGEAQADIKKETRVQPEEKPRVHLSKAKLRKALTVTAGEQGALPIELERGGGPADVEVRLEGLPAHVTALPMILPQKEFAESVILESAVEAEKGRYPVKVTVVVGTEKVDSGSFTLIVEKPHKKERVTFATIDHAQLVGTLYHGWRGKRGMCVLMLHDLDQDRSSPGWIRLALALQEEGHTVLTFDFRGCGESKKVPPKFWKYSVNKYLIALDPDKPAAAQTAVLDVDRLPGTYMPWLIHDIAAACTYLEQRHDEENSPVNTFNLVLLGAGEGSALGSLWLASEGVRFNATEEDGKMVPKPPEKLSVLQAVWIGLEKRLKRWTVPVVDWVHWAHQDPVVPVTFIYGADDMETYRLLQPMLSNHWGKAEVIADTALAGQQMLDKSEKAAKRVERYLMKTLKGLPDQKWVPRKLGSLRSYWAMPVMISPNRKQYRLIVAKRPGETLLQPVPLEHLEIQIPGLTPRKGFVPDRDEP